MFKPITELLLESLLRHYFSEADTSSLNLRFPSLNVRVYKSEGYFVAEIFFVFTPATFTTQNKL